MGNTNVVFRARAGGKTRCETTHGTARLSDVLPLRPERCSGVTGQQGPLLVSARSRVEAERRRVGVAGQQGACCRMFCL